MQTKMSELKVLWITIFVPFLTLLNINGLSNGLQLNWCPMNNNETYGYHSKQGKTNVYHGP